MLKYLAFSLLFNSCVCFNPSSELNKLTDEYFLKGYYNMKYAYSVSKKIYNSFNQSYFTIAYCRFNFFENGILKYLETYGNGYPVFLVNGCENKTMTRVKPRYSVHGKTTYLVTLPELQRDTTDAVITALQMTGIFQPRSTVIFVIKLRVELNNYFFYNMKINFQLLWSRMITNSVFILWSGKLRMYNYNPYLDELNDVTDVQDVSHLLTKQYNNLHGKELRLSVFRKVYVTDDTGPIVCNSRLAKTIMECLNATCKPVVPGDGSTVGDLLENGTATGVTVDLLDGYTDLELNSRILKNSYYGYIDTTYPLLQDKLCFIVKNSVFNSNFLTVIRLISGRFLFTFMFIFISLPVISILLRKLECKITNVQDKQSTGSILMDLIKCFLKQTVDIKYSGPVFRCLTLAIITYSMIVNCAIEGIITSAISTPHFKQDLNTLSLIKKENLTIGVHNRDFKIFKDSLPAHFFNSIKDQIEIFNDQKIKKVIEDRQYLYATLLRKFDADYIVKRPKNIKGPRQLFRVNPDCPVPCFIVFSLRYGSPYLDRINHILHHLYQAGIINYWMTTEEYPVGKNDFTGDVKDPNPFVMRSMEEVFVVFFIGITISTITFILEILIHKIRK